MRNLIALSIFVLMISSCRTLVNDDLIPAGNVPAGVNNLRPIFGNDFDKALYKANLNVSGREFSGLVMFKRISDDTLKFVFFNEFGMNFLDMEFAGDSGRVVRVVDLINYDIILNTIIRDIKLMLMNNIYLFEAEKFTDKTNSRDIYKYLINNEYQYFFVDKKSGLLEKAENCTLYSKEIEINYSNYSYGVPELINISNSELGLNITFKMIKR